MRRVSSDAVWFGAALALAFFVWVIATLQADPVRVAVFNNVPIQTVENDAMILTNRAGLRRTVTVNVRARESVLQLFTAEDITVRADWSNLAPGTHAVPLEVTTARRAVVDTRPAQLTVTLEQRQARQKPVLVEVLTDTPTGFVHVGSTPEQTQILISGTLAQVEAVDRLLARIDLNQARASFTDEVTLIPVDVNGVAVSDVALSQSTVAVAVEIRQREDVLAVPVSPQIDYDSVPAGYVARLDNFAPETATVRGSPALLALLPEILDTVEIDLSGRTASFTEQVAVELPDSLPAGTLTILEGQIIEVSVVIEARVAQRQFDGVPVQVVGSTGEVRVIPSRVSVILTGPQPILDALEPEDVAVTVDVTGLPPGTADVQPQAIITGAQIPADGVRVIPAAVGVIIVE
ncbi:MAG: CdaR family protein [Anaerolineae bacterium]|nr:CdaR family protein [Anaerolineae bacterium]